MSNGIEKLKKVNSQDNEVQEYSSVKGFKSPIKVTEIVGIDNTKATAKTLIGLESELKKAKENYQDDKSVAQAKYNSNNREIVDKSIEQNIVNSSIYKEAKENINAQLVGDYVNSNKDYLTAKESIVTQMELLKLNKDSELAKFNFDKVIEIEDKLSSLSKENFDINILANNDSMVNYTNTKKFLSMLDKDTAKTYLDNGKDNLIKIMGGSVYERLYQDFNN